MDSDAGTSAIAATKEVLNFFWGEMNKLSVRLAVMGPLADYFEDISYDVGKDKFTATSDHQLTPLMENIFDAAPGTSSGADVAYLQSWKPLIDVFLNDFDRPNGLEISYGYLFQNLVAAYENTLFGAAGNDTLYGGDGDDILIASDGIDSLYGGSGIDTFLFNATNTSSDTIADFSLAQGDKIDVSDILQGYDPLTDAIEDWVQITTSGSNSLLKVDVDGGANSFVQIATITGVTGLTDEAALVTNGNLIVS